MTEPQPHEPILGSQARELIKESARQRTAGLLLAMEVFTAQIEGVKEQLKASFPNPEEDEDRTELILKVRRIASAQGMAEGMRQAAEMVRDRQRKGFTTPEEMFQAYGDLANEIAAVRQGPESDLVGTLMEQAEWRGKQTEREHIIHQLRKGIDISLPENYHTTGEVAALEVATWLEEGLNADIQDFGDALKPVRDEEKRKFIQLLSDRAAVTGTKIVEGVLLELAYELEADLDE